MRLRRMAMSGDGTMMLTPRGIGQIQILSQTKALLRFPVKPRIRGDMKKLMKIPYRNFQVHQVRIM